MKTYLCSALFASLASLSFAQCPTPPDHRAGLQSLIHAIKLAPNERAAGVITKEMWRLWADAPDEAAQKLLDQGMALRERQDLQGAFQAFDQLVAYCPDYAEGYNQRAFVLFIQKDYPAALADLDRAIERSPHHIAAIAGKALTLIGLQRDEEAQTVLRDALALNPWLSERRFLSGDAPAVKTDL